MSNQYGRMDEHGQEQPEIVTPAEPKCSIVRDGSDDHAALKREVEAAVAKEDIHGLCGDRPNVDRLIASVENLEAQRDRQMRALGYSLQGSTNNLANISAALEAMGPIEASNREIADRLDALFYWCGRVTENIATLRGITYRAPITFEAVRIATLQGEGEVVAKMELRPDHIDQRIAKAMEAQS